MNFIFFGTPEFADIVLNELIKAGLPPALVVCNPDKPIGRKKIVTAPPTKITAQKHNIKTWQPEKLDLESCKNEFNGSELAVVAAYAKIIQLDVLGLFARGVIGVHPSLLPKYRGSSPIQATILSGDKETGVTLYILDEKMDRGQIVSNVNYRISDKDTYKTLIKNLAELGGKLLAETLPKFYKGEIVPEQQNESEATYTKKISTEDAFVDEKTLSEAIGGNESTATVIDRKIRSLNPEPGVWTIKNGKRLKLLEAEIKDGHLELRKTQIEGEKPRAIQQ